MVVRDKLSLALEHKIIKITHLNYAGAFILVSLKNKA